MRELLIGLTEEKYWCYGIDDSEFDHVLALVREMIAARNEQYQREEERVRAESPDVADDILDDIAYYRYTDNQYLWQFALWRLQGLLEAVITHQLLPAEQFNRLPGLRAKLIALRESGYTVNDDEMNELLLWANLRNALSHAPPEQYRPGPLNEDDIVEYHALVVEFYNRWHAERPPDNET